MLGFAGVPFKQTIDLTSPPLSFEFSLPISSTISSATSRWSQPTFPIHQRCSDRGESIGKLFPARTLFSLQPNLRSMRKHNHQPPHLPPPGLPPEKLFPPPAASHMRRIRSLHVALKKKNRTYCFNFVWVHCAVKFYASKRLIVSAYNWNFAQQNQILSKHLLPTLQWKQDVWWSRRSEVRLRLKYFLPAAYQAFDEFPQPKGEEKSGTSDDPETQRFSSVFELMAPEFLCRTDDAATRTWPQRSDCFPFSAAPSSEPDPTRFRRGKRDRSHVKSLPSTDQYDFSALPTDIVAKIGASLTLPNLRSASLVCRSWRDALQPLREAMLLLKFGKRFKHGRGGYKRNLDKALDCFLKGAKLGSALAMVDAGLMLWEAGRRDEAISLYEKAADLGDPAGQCNLGVSHLLAQPSNPQAAVKWLYRSSLRGCARAQYQLALCLHKGLGVESNFKEAAKWYLEAAEGGYVRAMYNTSICYSSGEGFHLSHYHARRWMKLAAERGHCRAQFDHGLALFSEGQMEKAAVYLELASRAGETAANPVKDVVLQQISASSHDRVMQTVNHWRPLPSCR